MRTMNDFIHEIGIDGNVEDFTTEQKYGIAHVIAYLTERNPRYGTIIIEYYQNNKTQAEIGKMIGVSQGTVQHTKLKMIQRAKHPMFSKWIIEGIDLGE